MAGSSVRIPGASKLILGDSKRWSGVIYYSSSSVAVYWLVDGGIC